MPSWEPRDLAHDKFEKRHVFSRLTLNYKRVTLNHKIHAFYAICNTLQHTRKRGTPGSSHTTNLKEYKYFIVERNLSREDLEAK